MDCFQVLHIIRSCLCDSLQARRAIEIASNTAQIVQQQGGCTGNNTSKYENTDTCWRQSSAYPGANPCELISALGERLQEKRE